MESIERYRGCLLGLAAGDAFGTTLEFRSPGSFSPIDDIVGGGPFGLRPGEWTDDTSMALCLAESLLECRGFDPVDQLLDGVPSVPRMEESRPASVSDSTSTTDEPRDSS